jgi:hypothetical protein
MGDTSRFQTKIYKRLAATEKANHQPIWRAQRRQLEAHAHAQALLYRNSATALEHHPAAVQRNNGAARRFEARKKIAGRRRNAPQRSAPQAVPTRRHPYPAPPQSDQN